LLQIQPIQPAFGDVCECHNKQCTDCVYVKTGTECTKDCFCSDYDPNAADLKVLEMDDNDLSDTSDEIPAIDCHNNFIGFKDLCALCDIEQPSMCFQSYVARRSQTILSEYTPCPEEVSDMREWPEIDQGVVTASPSSGLAAVDGSACPCD
jgi:hypothetical protein